MQLLRHEAFFDLFRSFEHTACHLEVVDTYSTPEESEPFRKFLAGEPDDFEWFEDWTSLVREVTTSGRVMRRVRVVSEPHVDYTRWGLAVAHYNIDAGEDIRYLPRHLIDPSELSADDFWLFDDNLVSFTTFTPEGAAGGGATTTDPVIVEYIRSVWNRVWDKAVPHAEYIRA
ncbi:DUF6879 family protein [Nocardia terpenica]|uniref:DUF6879 domain-containing protein n=1 Tax=Nocardia terpenica TaxID=455432 RepID=A0A6G9Z4K3_9NOCA|nr:DUF6879 family protein [Nocardia terpenica]QIS20468.1 hypothetical protein F6W96_21395 [Nocardia terpenica]